MVHLRDESANGDANSLDAVSFSAERFRPYIPAPEMIAAQSDFLTSPPLRLDGELGLYAPSCSSLRVLVACEYSGTVRDAFRCLGHDAWSCDVLPTDAAKQWHLECKVEEVINEGWDLMIAHPPCTFLSVSGIHWNDRGRGWEGTDAALDFVRLLMAADIPKIAIENPVSVISSKIRKPDQIIQPHQYGHDASKATCLWLKGLPRLHATESIPPRIIDGKKRWKNQTDGGQNKLAPSADRWKLRSTTYAGIARAMAEQWGGKFRQTNA